MKKGDIVAINWLDSCAPSERHWHWPSEVNNEIPQIISVGQVFKLNDEAVTLVSSWHPATKKGQVGGIISIPLCAIIKSVELELA